MYLNSEDKKAIFEKYGKSNTDTGSPESQIKRRRLLDYLIRTDIARYRAIIAQEELGIRK